MPKRVLVISYYWPPAGGISVLRSLKIVKYLREYGWEPVVFTVSNPNYPILDSSNERHIPENLEIIKGPMWEPFSLYKKATRRREDDPMVNVLTTHDDKPSLLHRLAVWVRGNFFIPDARAPWIKPSVKRLSRYLKENPVEAIFTDGPPHTNTRIATLLSKKFDLPWLADFQDPWTQVDYYQLFPITRWADRIHRRQEQEAFQQAQKTTIVSPTWKEDLEAIGAKNVSVIVWGYDEADYEGLSPQLDEKFTLSHLGHLGDDRVPGTLLQVIADLCKEDTAFREAVSVQLIGSVDRQVNRLVEELGLQKQVEIIRHIPRTKALQRTLNSQMLLLLLNKADNAMGRIPGKLFEYLRAGRPILCHGPRGCDVENILTHTQSGDNREYDDYQGIREVLAARFSDYQQGGLKLQQQHLEQYNIKSLTGTIAQYLNEITA